MSRRVGAVFFQQVDHLAAQDGEVAGAVVLADAVGVFVKAHIQAPVQVVLHAPVAAHRRRRDLVGLPIDGQLARRQVIVPVGPRR